jgi:hypothetical protein
MTDSLEERRPRNRPSKREIEPPVVHSVSLSMWTLALGALAILALAGLAGAIKLLAYSLQHPVDRAPARERGPRLVTEDPPAGAK